MVSAPDFDKSCWFDQKFSLGLDFPNLPYFVDGEIKLTQVAFVVICHFHRQLDCHCCCNHIPPFLVNKFQEGEDKDDVILKILFQTNAIMRYIARKHDLCGKVLPNYICGEDKYLCQKYLH